ncbi:MAG: hypothetical protein R3321_12950 [Nitrososphaeraceae archaeon]|nr:hypothetical protein [Nitrososphaeraceae archaeon]
MIPGQEFYNLKFGDKVLTNRYGVGTVMKNMNIFKRSVPLKIDIRPHGCSYFFRNEIKEKL